jgi:hypothetical protein
MVKGYPPFVSMATCASAQGLVTLRPPAYATNRLTRSVFGPPKSPTLTSGSTTGVVMARLLVTDGEP